MLFLNELFSSGLAVLFIKEVKSFSNILLSLNLRCHLTDVACLALIFNSRQSPAAILREISDGEIYSGAELTS